MRNEHPFSGIDFDQVVYLGAGDGQSLAELTEQLSAKQWHLVEGDKKQTQKLQRVIEQLTTSANFVVHENIVSAKEQQASWYNYNLPEYSGLKKAKDLKTLFPGLKLAKRVEVKTTALPELIQGLKLNDTANNLLIIDLPGQALELMTALQKAKQKTLFSQVVITATEQQAFEDGGTRKQLQTWLQKQGLHTRNEPYDDPDFPVLYYSYDKRSEAAFNELQQERDDAISRATAAEQQRDEAAARAADATTQFDALKNEITQRQKDILQAVNQVARKQERSQSDTALYFNEQFFWQTGQYPTQQTLLAERPKLKDFLLRRVVGENYDVILQFGISDICLYIAEVLKRSGVNTECRHLTSLSDDDELDFNKRKGSGKKASQSEKGESDKRLNKIMVVDSSNQELDVIRQKAAIRGVEQMITTHKAPLVDFNYHGEDFLHYELDNLLKELQQEYAGKHAKCLIIVSGPTGEVAGLSRFPAAPKVINTLTDHEIHFITDNYSDDDAKNVAVKWSKLFDERGMPVEKQLLADSRPGFAWLLNR